MATVQSRKRERRAVLISSSDNDDGDDSNGARPAEAKRQKTHTRTQTQTQTKIQSQLTRPSVPAKRLNGHTTASARHPPPQPSAHALRRSTRATPAAAQFGGLELTASGSSSAGSSANAPKPSSLSRSRQSTQPQTRTTSAASARSSISPITKKNYRTTRKKSESPQKLLQSFFQKPSREQSWAGSQNTVTTLNEVEEIQDDEIEDFFSDDEELGKLLNEETQKIESKTSTVPTPQKDAATLDRRKSPRTIAQKPAQAPKAPTHQSKITNIARSTKRFILPETIDLESTFSSQSSVTNTQHDDIAVGRPWADQYPPVNMDELAVHKRKVSDVQRWLTDVFTGRSRQRVLVLRGPAGSGKTTTVSLLAKVLGYEIIEWRQPLISEYSAYNNTSLSAQFDEFLGRGEQFGALTLTGDDDSTVRRKSQNMNSSNQRRIILVEDFPSFLGQGSTGLLAFRASLQKYLAATVPTSYCSAVPPDSPPIVMIISEAMLGSASGTFDSFSSYRLLGPDISGHPGIGFIDFNPVAPTFMAKAIDLVLKKDARRSNRKQIPGTAVLKQFYGSGDIRSAISAVEFFCLRTGDLGRGNDRSAANRSRKSSAKEPTVTEKESLQMITQREASLGLFHATGKVVHNKRDHPKDVTDSSRVLPHPPAHLPQHTRPLVSQVSVDELMNETGTDVSTFLASLHENFPLSCNGTSFTEYYDNCMEYLADADLLGSDSHKSIRSGRLGLGSARSSLQGYGGGIDMLRQDEISFQVGVRGLLFSLPYPVKRTLNSRAGRGYGDAHKMYYPGSAQLWRRTEELEGMVDHWVHKLTVPTQQSSSSETDAERIGVESWQRLSPHPTQTEHHARNEASRALLSREDVLLERLPYLQRITRDQTERTSLEQLTRFTGTGSRWSQFPEDEPESESSATAEQTDDRKLLAAAQKGAAGFQRSRIDPPDSGSIETAGNAIEKLVLSDDDIEDD